MIRHYIELFEGAFLFKALSKYCQKAYKKKSSSPKVLPACPALCAITQSADVIKDPVRKGRLFELAVGNVLGRMQGATYYWREGNSEVDYVYTIGDAIYAIEVKSGLKRSNKGLDVFVKTYPSAKRIIIDPDLFERFDAEPEKILSALAI